MQWNAEMVSSFFSFSAWNWTFCENGMKTNAQTQNGKWNKDEEWHVMMKNISNVFIQQDSDFASDFLFLEIMAMVITLLVKWTEVSAKLIYRRARCTVPVNVVSILFIHWTSSTVCVFVCLSVCNVLGLNIYKPNAYTAFTLFLPVLVGMHLVPPTLVIHSFVLLLFPWSRAFFFCCSRRGQRRRPNSSCSSAPVWYYSIIRVRN